ncbi:MAG: cephalosporin hydroxylase family protein [Paracoccaceae bacterium]
MSFEKEKIERIASYENNKILRDAAAQFTYQSAKENYVYNFSWLGRPIIQYPQDIVIIQELIHEVKPDLIVETGIAHGGSLMLSASMLALNEIMGGPKNPLVVGVDIDIRAHNREAIEKHPLYKYIVMIGGSSTDEKVIAEITKLASKKETVMVFLDSNHSHEHVLQELNAYGGLVTKGSYCVVFDTFVEDMPNAFVVNRPWDKGNNPKTAIQEYLSFLKKESEKFDNDEESVNFNIDYEIDNKLLISCNAGGFLKRV